MEIPVRLDAWAMAHSHVAAITEDQDVMKLSVSIVLLAGLAAWAADPIPLDVKPGQWEATVTTQFTGMPQARQMPQISPDQLGKLPPEQRARVEAMLKQTAGGPRTSTSKSCVKKEDLTKLPLNNDQSCKTTIVNSSRARQEIQMECDRNGNKETGTIVIEALNSESIKFSIQAAADNNGKNMNMTITGTSKWLGPACSDSK
jgi:hypothetical protein